MTITAALACLAALASSLCFTRITIGVAHRRGWIDAPKADRWHEVPTAMYGGVAMFAAFSVCASVFLPLLWHRHDYDLVGLLLGGALMFALGVRDDIRPLDPQMKMLGQVMAVTPFIVGLGHTDLSPTFLWTMPIVLLWCVTLTNSFNLLDNMDGLSAGTAAVVGTMIALYASMHGAPNAAALAGILVAASLGFLWFNLRIRERALIFMGDGGSLPLGYMLAGLCVCGVSATSSTHFVGAVVLPLLIMAVPLFDTLLVIIVRKREGRAISQGGRDHTSHRLVYAGCSEKGAVAILYAISALAGGVAVLVHTLHHPRFTLLTFAVCSLALASLGSYLSKQEPPMLVLITEPEPGDITAVAS